MKRLVLVGGGHAHVHVLKALGDAPLPGLDATLVTPVEKQVYSGMLPGYVAGHYTLDECSVALAPLARRAGVAVRQSAATRIDPARREVTLADGGVVPYDVLSLDVGSRAFVGAAKGVESHAIAIRPLERFVPGWEAVLARFREGRVRSVSVVGGGAAGVEIAFAIDERFRSEAGERAPHVRILTDGDGLVPEHPDAVRRLLLRQLRRRHIGVHPRAVVAEVAPGHVRLRERIQFATDATFWVAGAAAHPFIGESGLRTDDRGFLAVDDCLRSVSHPEVFGAGDCATNLEHPRPKAGVFAVRAGPALAIPADTWANGIKPSRLVM